MNIEELIKRGESEKIEFKENFGKEAIESLTAMANTKGGFVIIGVKDNGKISGVTLRKNALAKWANEIAQNTEPKIIADFEVEEINGKKIVIIKVDEFPIKPVLFRGRAFKRVGASNKRLTPREIAEMFEASTGISWDYYPVDATIDDIDFNAVSNFAKMADLDRYDEEEILRKLHLVRDDIITRAAILLFGKNVQDFFINAVVRVGRFKGSEILDSVDIRGNLFNQVEETMNAIKKHLSKRFVIKETRREEVWEYPLTALREAVINAVIHRDYRRPEEIQIKIYDDHLSIWNPGELPYDLTVEDLYREHHSHPRNRLIAEVFYLAGYIEKWGSGTLRILEAAKNEGLLKVTFSITGEGFKVEFWKDIYNEEYLRKLGLNEREIKAVMYVKEKGRITNKEYQKINNVSDRTASRELKHLVELKLLDRIGNIGAGVYYVLSATKTPNQPKIRQEHAKSATPRGDNERLKEGDDEEK